MRDGQGREGTRQGREGKGREGKGREGKELKPKAEWRRVRGILCIYILGGEGS